MQTNVANKRQRCNCVTVQLDDEASLLPRKLQAALEQALEQRNDIINQDSDSESDEPFPPRPIIERTLSAKSETLPDPLIHSQTRHENSLHSSRKAFHLVLEHG